MSFETDLQKVRNEGKGFVRIQGLKLTKLNEKRQF